ncbi:MAG: hypothetical protein D6712_11985 [Chloroflexi bacterium]|nr:MAG: hypothetical protein D6712_11985 [Chloroflexota bacterium]
MRKRIRFSDDWYFCPHQVTAGEDGQFERVHLPHSNYILPYHNFDEKVYQFTSTYRKRFTLPYPQNGGRIFLDFDGAMMAATIILNEQEFPEHRGGYVPFSLDITDYVVDGENELIVLLDSSERKDIPPYGYVVDYLSFGGIYRDVWLRYTPAIYLDNVFITTENVLDSEANIKVGVRVHNQSTDTQPVIIETIIRTSDGQEIARFSSQPLELTTQTQQEVELKSPVTGFALWTLDEPNLYTAEIIIKRDGEAVDRIEERFGFREAAFKEDGFYLNGEKIYLRGLNRHQTYPYIGSAAPERLQKRDADIIKYDLGCNIVRTSHYPQSPYFLDRCDEIGLLVFEEIPGWQHVGDEGWQALALRDLQVMIERDRNRPAIVLWGVRINESLDNDEFYEKTNALARKLDPTRQTGGVRFFQQSNFLEDVFTFNDFSNGVESPLHRPHLITEFAGHMYPTKTWDNEDRVLEHALLHTRVHNQAMATEGVSGAIGWCAFDYNTHKEFGSGDKICYHGVMDIFRLPKFAAYFYSSQISPEERIVLQAATYWTNGDRSGGGNDPLVIFSNCDEIEVYIGERLIGKFEPDRTRYPNLAHPPFTVEGLGMRWGDAYDDLRVIGYYQGNKVAEQQIDASNTPHTLKLWCDDTQLYADGCDMTRVAFQVVDKYGNRLPYAHTLVELSLEGYGELIGENPFVLVGGQGAVYLKAGETSGIVHITAKARGLPEAKVSVTLITP